MSSSAREVSGAKNADALPVRMSERTVTRTSLIPLDREAILLDVRDNNMRRRTHSAFARQRSGFRGTDPADDPADFYCQLPISITVDVRRHAKEEDLCRLRQAATEQARDLPGGAILLEGMQDLIRAPAQIDAQERQAQAIAVNEDPDRAVKLER